MSAAGVDSVPVEVDSKTQELADTVETNEAAKQNKVDTEAALAADTKFLEDLKVSLSISGFSPFSTRPSVSTPSLLSSCSLR